jgi:hypothetical protein
MNTFTFILWVCLSCSTNETHQEILKAEVELKELIGLPRVFAANSSEINTANFDRLILLSKNEEVLREKLKLLYSKEF